MDIGIFEVYRLWNCVIDYHESGHILVLFGGEGFYGAPSFSKSKFSQSKLNIL